MYTEKVFIVGAGVMGSGIAQVCAQSGIKVILNDVDPSALEKAIETISWSINKFIEKGNLVEAGETILNRIQTASDFSEAADADLAVEAVFENLDLKRNIFKKLDGACKPEAPIFSNTSAIPITELASVTGRSEKVGGLHFFNPVPMMQVVEVIKGLDTSDETLQIAIDFVRMLNKEPIRVNTDISGFLLNRINLASYVEAIRLLELGIGTISDIDKGVRLAFGRRMGPFETGDMVGLDVSYGALKAIYDDTKDIRFYPPRLLKRKVTAGRLGRKSGEGWYQYNKNGSRKVS